MYSAITNKTMVSMPGDPLNRDVSILESSGKERILEAAARLFGGLGYEKTSIRSISRESGMKAGSIYYFFKSKEDILLDVYARGFDLMFDIVSEAISVEIDPWGKLYNACAAHLEGIFEHRTFIEATVRELPDRYSEPTRTRMKEIRHRYESIFTEIINELPLHSDVDRSSFRLTLLGSMAWSLVWFDLEGPYTPKHVAQKMVDLFRYPCGR